MEGRGSWEVWGWGKGAGAEEAMVTVAQGLEDVERVTEVVGQAGWAGWEGAVGRRVGCWWRRQTPS